MQSILFQGSLIQIKNLDLSKLIILIKPQVFAELFFNRFKAVGIGIQRSKDLFWKFFNVLLQGNKVVDIRILKLAGIGISYCPEGEVIILT